VEEGQGAGPWGELALPAGEPHGSVRWAAALHHRRFWMRNGSADAEDNYAQHSVDQNAFVLSLIPTVNPTAHTDQGRRRLVGEVVSLDYRAPVNVWEGKQTCHLRAARRLGIRIANEESCGCERNGRHTPVDAGIPLVW